MPERRRTVEASGARELDLGGEVDAGLEGVEGHAQQAIANVRGAVRVETKREPSIE
jgi:hypothetical protein